ncbi:restriction endonuclease [Clostridium thailandense]|uniref:restriction endonuclease n=1 Tax=Clostridium thailandense TaxID=2794346 RepID=UPI003988E539
MQLTFMDKLIDWKEFELFIQKMYQEDSDLIVEHDVTLVGKSGSKRQIDVLITQKTKFHIYNTLVECKRWKQKIDRSIVDILFASIEDLNASKGVIFTTVGYEAGAEKYAKSKNIDIFVIRDLTSEEWGLPGRIIHFYMHVIGSNLINIQLPGAKLIAIVDNLPTNLNLNIEISKNNLLDDKFILYSKRDGNQGGNLVSLLFEKNDEIIHKIGQQIPILEDGKDKVNLVINSDIELDFSNYEFRQLRIKEGAIDIEKLSYRSITHISQTSIHFDRGDGLNLALIAENYVRHQKHVISQKKEENNLQVTENLFDDPVREKIVSEGNILENDSIMKVYMEPWIKVDLTGNEIVAHTNKICIKL